MNCELEAALRQPAVSVHYDRGVLFVREGECEYNYKLDARGYFRLSNRDGGDGGGEGEGGGGDGGDAQSILHSTPNCRLCLEKGRVVLKGPRRQLVVCESAKHACATQDYLVVAREGVVHIFDICTLELLQTVDLDECTVLEAVGFNVIRIGNNSFINIKRQT